MWMEPGKEKEPKLADRKVHMGELRRFGRGQSTKMKKTQLKLFCLNRFVGNCEIRSLHLGSVTVTVLMGDTARATGVDPNCQLYYIYIYGSQTHSAHHAWPTQISMPTWSHVSFLNRNSVANNPSNAMLRKLQDEVI